MNKSARRSLSVFLVENHHETLKSLEMYLKNRGCKVHAAEDMQEALEMLPKLRCDVFLCDIGLPDGDGWELIERAQFPKNVYSIAMSGFGTEADIARSRAVGFRQHLLKPFELENLAEMLDEAAAERANS